VPGLACVVYFEGDDPDAIAVPGNVICNGAAGAKRGGEYKANLALLEDVRRTIALAGFRAGIGYEAHAECGSVVVGGLTRVSHVEFDVIGALEGQKILSGLDRAGGKGCHGDLRFECERT
jgi:hypothetical protein